MNATQPNTTQSTTSANTTTPHPFRVELAVIIKRCSDAYFAVRAKLKKDDIGFLADERNQRAASLAYIALLPALVDPADFQHYIAAVNTGVGLGAIDVADSGRLLHLAHSAMAAWKLANITVPEFEHKQREWAQKDADRQSGKSERKAAPPSPLANAPESIQVELALQHALNTLPRFDEQKKYFHILRNHGHVLPCDAELRDHPLAALHLIRQAEQIIQEETLAEAAKQAKPSAEPAPAPAAQPSQAA